MSKSINTRYSEIIAKHRQQDAGPNKLEPSEVLNPARPAGEGTKKAAKSKDPNYVKLTLYVQLDTLTAAKIKALQQRKDLSDVADELLRTWARG
jgi:hypothetical protein